MQFSWQTLNVVSAQLATYAWSVLWQSSVLILAVWVIDIALKRRASGSLRYALWLLVLCRLLVPPSFAAPSGLAWWLRPRLANTPQSSALVTVRYLADVNRTPSPDRKERRTSPAAPRCSLASIGAAISLAGTLVLVGCVIYRQRQINALLRRAAPAPPGKEAFLADARRALGLRAHVRLLISPDQISPAVCGLFRPVIILPQSLAAKLSGSQLRSVLLHELAHVQRGDIWVSCLQSLLQLIYWWHPLLWLANARVRSIREEAVDDSVVGVLAKDWQEYATTLVEVARLGLRRPIPALGFVGILESGAMLRQRIQRLADLGAQRKIGVSVFSLCALAAFTAIAMPMGPATGSRPRPQTFEDRTPVQEMPTGAASATNRAILKHGSTVLSADKITVDSVKGEVRAEGNVRLQTPEPLLSKVFKIDPNTLRENLIKITGSDWGGTNIASVREFLKRTGIDLQPPKTVYYKDREGRLLVRATAADLRAIEAALQQLNAPAAQIHARIQVAQVSPSEANEFWAGLALQQPTNKLAFLGSQEAAKQFGRLKALAAPDQFSEASIKTLSGRQAQIQIGELLNITRASPTNHVEPFVGNGLQMGGVIEQVPVGYTIDLLPYADEDGKTVQVTLSGNYTEFLGYDDPGAFVPQVDAGSGAVMNTKPLPRFRIRTVTAKAVLLDQQTMVIGGSDEVTTDQIPVFGGDRPRLGRLFRRPGQPEKEVILFVTPTLVDPAGNPVHSEGR